MNYGREWVAILLVGALLLPVSPILALVTMFIIAKLA